MKRSKSAWKYTPDAKDKMVDQVDAYRAKGLLLDEACKKAGVKKSIYQWWKGKREGKYDYSKKSETPMPLPATPSIPHAIAGGRRGLIARLYEVKRALMDLEQAILMDDETGERSAD